MANIELAGRARLTPFRHIALGTWRTAYDPSIYGSVTVPMDATLRYIEAFRAATGLRLTVTHLMAKVVGTVLAEVPEINAVLRFGRVYLRRDISVFFQVALEDPKTGGIDLSGVQVASPHTADLASIVRAFEASAAQVRARTDRQGLARSRANLLRIPGVLIGAVMRALSFLNYTLNLDMRWAGIPRDPFGGAMVTNIGSLGLEAAYVPLVPFSRVPILIALGAVEDAACVEHDAETGAPSIVARKVMRLYATFDHRLVDGAHAAKMVKIVRAFFADPFAKFGAIERAPAVIEPASPA
jgi:pyruvate/2-oxoglutarate dehydrogenase complex dihydrolipoamide acyltransferase (E2) component